VRATGGTFLAHGGTVASFGDTEGAESVKLAAESLLGREAGVVSESGSEEGCWGVEGFVAGVSRVISAGARVIDGLRRCI